MNVYHRKCELQPFFLDAKSLTVLWNLLDELMPKGDSFYEATSISTELPTVTIDEQTLEGFLNNPDLPASAEALVLRHSKAMEMENMANTYTISVHLNPTYASLGVDGPDEAWAIGATGRVEAFFAAHRRRFACTLQSLSKLSPVGLGVSLGGVVPLVIVATLRRDPQLLVLGAMAALATLAFSLTVLIGLRTPTTKVAFEGHKSDIPQALAVAAVACVFTVLTFIVAIAQLLKK
jgi:hypothetical protein